MTTTPPPSTPAPSGRPATYDLVVVGAGPAGATCARAAALAGLRVLLLDKARFPRAKPCAGALSCQALHQLDLPLPENLVEREFTGGRLWYKDRCIEAHKPYRAGVLVRRERFDAWLVEQAAAAGAEVRLGQAVRSVADNNGRVLARTADDTLSGRFLVVAEGASGRLKTAVRPPDRPRDYTFCVCADIESPEAMGDVPMDIRFGIARAGYGWVFSRRGEVSIGIGEQGDRLTNPVALMHALLAANGFPATTRLVGHKIPMGGVPRRVAAGRILLAGDAAGFADAILGEGIAYALASGRLAGERLAAHLAGSDPEPPAAAYTAACQASLGEELRQTLYLARCLRLAPDRLLAVILSDREALSRYIDILAGKLSYKTFNRWMLRRLPLFFWRAMVGGGLRRAGGVAPCTPTRRE
jgi:geranylgeranyl reductase family protein